jgi:hypothetical protein
MFEEYLQDSSEFLRVAQDALSSGKPGRAKSYYRASVFCAACAMEAFVNYIADSFSKAGSLESNELAYLMDKKLFIDPGKGLVQRIEYHSVDGKLKVLIARFFPAFDYNVSMWSKFMKFKDLRDALVHPRIPEDETPIELYAKQVPAGLKATIILMNEVSTAVFRSPLRKQLLDLIPED